MTGWPLAERDQRSLQWRRCHQTGQALNKYLSDEEDCIEHTLKNKGV